MLDPAQSPGFLQVDKDGGVAAATPVLVSRPEPDCCHDVPWVNADSATALVIKLSGRELLPVLPHEAHVLKPDHRSARRKAGEQTPVNTIVRADRHHEISG